MGAHARTGERVTMDEARAMFPSATRIERTTWNGRPCWVVVVLDGSGTEWAHYVEVER